MQDKLRAYMDHLFANTPPTKAAVEEFKEWKFESDERKKTLKSINSSIGTIFLVLYFIISFSTGACRIECESVSGDLDILKK